MDGRRDVPHDKDGGRRLASETETGKKTEETRGDRNESEEREEEEEERKMDVDRGLKCDAVPLKFTYRGGGASQSGTHTSCFPEEQQVSIIH